MKDHIQQHEDYEEHDGKNEFQALFGTQLKFVFAGPLVGVSRRQSQFLLQQTRSLLYEAAIVARVQVDVDIAGELAAAGAEVGVRQRVGIGGGDGVRSLSQIGGGEAGDLCDEGVSSA